jgi:hypothetical protein
LDQLARLDFIEIVLVYIWVIYAHLNPYVGVYPGPFRFVQSPTRNAKEGKMGGSRSLTVTLETVTPLFLGGAEREQFSDRLLHLQLVRSWHRTAWHHLGYAGVNHDGLVSQLRLIDGKPESVSISNGQRCPQPQGELAAKDQTLFRWNKGDSHFLGFAVIQVSSGKGEGKLGVIGPGQPVDLHRYTRG